MRLHVQLLSLECTDFRCGLCNNDPIYTACLCFKGLNSAKKSTQGNKAQGHHPHNVLKHGLQPSLWGNRLSTCCFNELLRFRALQHWFSSLEMSRGSKKSQLASPARWSTAQIPLTRKIDENSLMQFSSDSFRHFKGISIHKLVFLNKKVCIIIKPLDHEILFAPNINCSWKIFAQDLASTVRQNMNS